MTAKRQVTASTNTHFPNMEKVKVEEGDQDLENSQEGMMLTDPEDDESGFTHSQETPKLPGASKKPPVTAAIHDPEDVQSGPTHTDNEGDPAAGYLEKEAGLPVINNVVAEVEDEEDEFGQLDNESEPEEVHAEGFGDDEFDDLDDLPVGEEPAEGPAEPGSPNEDAGIPVAADFEAESTEDEIPLVDADGVKDEDHGELQFATTANSVHVIRSNRIIASMGPKSALKAGVDDVYLSDQFQEVVAHSVTIKGLRKGLVQAGFKLATVKIKANAATAKVVKAKVEATLKEREAVLAKRDAALEQSLAIAAVGINRRFFKEVTNELRAGLETELSRAGVRGGSHIVKAMFAQHGVSYAKAILTLAKRIVTLPEEIRSEYIKALDMTDSEDFEEAPMEVESEFEDVPEEDEMEPVATMAHVTAALSTPLRRDSTPALLKAGVKSSSALAILAGKQSLI